MFTHLYFFALEENAEISERKIDRFAHETRTGLDCTYDET